MITRSKQEEERDRKERERVRAEAIRYVFGNQVTFDVHTDGVLRAYRGNRPLCENELSTTFLQKVAAATQDAMRGGQ